MATSSDHDLISFMEQCSIDSMSLVISSVHSKLSMDSWSYFDGFVSGKEVIPPPKTNERGIVARRVHEQLSYFGSHSIPYMLRKISPFHDKPGVGYAEILRDVEETLHKQLSPQSSPARIASIKERERQVAQLLLSSTLENIPESELAEMLAETGLDHDAALKSAKELKNPALGAGAIFAAVRVLGKKAVRDFMLAILATVLTKMAQKEGAKQVAIQIAKKFPQKAFVRLSNYVGYVLLAYDAIQMAGPAKRITVPTVVTIAVLRTSERLQQNAS